MSGPTCTICHFVDVIVTKFALLLPGSSDHREEMRAHLLVAFIMGLRREPIDMCNGCRQRCEKALVTIPPVIQ